MKKLTKLFITIAIIAVSAVSVLGFSACDFTIEFNEDASIQVVSREIGSGSRYAIMSMLFGGDWADIRMPVDTIVQSSTAAIFGEVSTNTHAIGYESMGHASGSDEVKMLNLEGVAPTPANVRSGAYALTRPLSVVYRLETAVNNEAATEFRRFLSSTQAAVLIDEFGYVSGISSATAFIPTPGISGTVRVVGSTTVHPLMNRLEAEFNRLRGTVNTVTITVAGGGSGAGRNAIRDNTAEFGMVSAPVSATHMTEMTSGTAETVNVHTLADDAIVIIVHPSNPMTNITRDQLRHLYNRDSVTTFSSWRELMAYGE